MKMHYKVWSRGKSVRIAKIFKDRGLWNVTRLYPTMEGDTFKSYVERYDSMGLNGLAHWTQTAAGAPGREIVKYDLTKEQADKLVAAFDKKAEKDGFEFHGVWTR